MASDQPNAKVAAVAAALNPASESFSEETLHKVERAYRQGRDAGLSDLAAAAQAVEQVATEQDARLAASEALGRASKHLSEALQEYDRASGQAREAGLEFSPFVYPQTPQEQR
jgi:hypothetical protein